MLQIGFFTIGKYDAFLSDYLKDLKFYTQNKINFVKNCRQWGLNSHSSAVSTELGKNLLGRFLK